jgi:ribosomal protein L11 methyltransferase
MKNYFVLKLGGVSAVAEDWLSVEAFAHGALGISENLDFAQPEGEEEVFTQVADRRALDIYFAAAPADDSLQLIGKLWPQVQIHVQCEAERDWLAEWKKGFQPFCLVQDYWVVPSWCQPPASALAHIKIDPGMAFGTGTHETTQLVAQALVEIGACEKLHSVLDVGTGTGILAMLARQLGIAEIQATEIEEDARRVAKENFAANGCSDILLDARQIEQLTRTYDIVMANIIDGVLVRVQDALKARVRPGGWLIVSGIITERERDFLTGFRLPQGLVWTKRVQKGDWLLFATRL